MQEVVFNTMINPSEMWISLAVRVFSRAIADFFKMTHKSSIHSDPIMEPMIRQIQHGADRIVLSGLRLHRTRVESTTGFSGNIRRAADTDDGADTTL